MNQTERKLIEAITKAAIISLPTEGRRTAIEFAIAKLEKLKERVAQDIGNIQSALEMCRRALVEATDDDVARVCRAMTSEDFGASEAANGVG